MNAAGSAPPGTRSAGGVGLDVCDQYRRMWLDRMDKMSLNETRDVFG